MSPRSLGVCSIATLLMVSQPAFAQPHIRESIVVTATASPVSFENLGRWVTVLSREQIARLPARSVADVLRFALGIDVRSRGPAGVQSDFSIRGAGFGQTLVLIDGIRINDTQSGHHNSDIPVPLEAIERIEVIYGPGSSLYGADAFGGTVNVITRSTEPRRTLSSAAGDFGLLEGGFHWSGAVPASHSIAVNGARSSGFMADRDFGALTLAGQTRLGTTVVQAGHVRKEFGANGFYGPSPSREWTNQTMATVEQPLFQDARWRATAVASYRTHGDRFLWDVRQPGVFENRHRTHAALGGIKVRGRAGAATAVTAGGELGGDWMKSTNLGDHRFVRTGLYAELQHSVGPLVVYPGLRYDSYSTFGSAWSPSLSASLWLGPAVRLRGAAGRAFRIPTFTELYHQDPAHQAAGQLRPESAWGGEGGIDWLVGTSWLLSGTVFARRERDGIDWVRETSSVKWRSTNLRHVNTHGLELEARRFVGPSGMVAVQYTAVDTDALPVPLLSKYILDYARRSWAVTTSAGLPWQIGLGQRVGWTDRSTTSGYLVADVRLSRRFREIEVFAEGTNVLDQRYQEIAGVDMPGRWVRFGLTVSAPTQSSPQTPKKN